MTEFARIQYLENDIAYVLCIRLILTEKCLFQWAIPYVQKFIIEFDQIRQMFCKSTKWASLRETLTQINK